MGSYTIHSIHTERGHMDDVIMAARAAQMDDSTTRKPGRNKDSDCDEIAAKCKLDKQNVDEEMILGWEAIRRYAIDVCGLRQMTHQYFLVHAAKYRLETYKVQSSKRIMAKRRDILNFVKRIPRPSVRRVHKDKPVKTI
jgi:hypothetical protein